MEFLDEIAEFIKGIADCIGLKRHDEKRTKSRQTDGIQNTAVSGADMAKRLKMLMSIPVNTQNYSEELDDFLEQIWKEKVSAFETEGRRNEFMLYSGRLDLLKQYANEKNGIRLKAILEEMLRSLEKDRYSV